MLRLKSQSAHYNVHGGYRSRMVRHFGMTTHTLCLIISGIAMGTSWMFLERNNSEGNRRAAA